MQDAKQILGQIAAEFGPRAAVVAAQSAAAHMLQTAGTPEALGLALATPAGQARFAALLKISQDATRSVLKPLD